MKLELTPTAQIDVVNGTNCRLWVGVDDQGVEVRAYIAALSPASTDEAVNARYAGELNELSLDQAYAMVVLDLRPQ